MAELHKIGRAGHIAGYDVFITAGRVVVSNGDFFLAHDVPNYGTDIFALAERPGFRLGWAQMPDDAEILYFYDRDDDGFGYALNLSEPRFSEWGYSPFRDPPSGDASRHVM